MEVRAKKLADELVKFHADLLKETPKDAIEAPASIASALAVPLARLVRALVPNAQTKLDELVYAADNDLQVNPNTKGYDLKTADGKHIERKVSVCTTRSPKCNFNWPVPPVQEKDTADASKRRKILLESVTEKTKNGGGAIFEVQDGLGRTLATYKLHEHFLIAYFSRIKLHKSDVHNMGCARCSTCHRFHRLHNMAVASLQMEAAGGDPNVVDWSLFTKKVASDCGNAAATL